ncbi:MAG TPA: pitrilysin family protein [Tepidisphaeraceae bacterium]|nr:pitrilysin family protein [Tepidisphaeraceae bacterium]
MLNRRIRLAVIFLLFLATNSFAAPQTIDFTEEKLPNGLRVIYAPLHQAPVVHVRVLYHVGSRDERPDRQGFAHMFEHMMFRGSAHVKPEQHMKLINRVGGNSNAFTSFDQTVYVNTLPANHLEMALYLEADRMASFKVSEEIYDIERKVVAEEWRRRQNQPYGTLFEDFLKLAFIKHSYRWTPIGDMGHLKAARVSELQEFFNQFYTPNNAILVVAGDFDVQSAKALVQKYFAWIPAGGDITRRTPAEPPQKETRKAVVPRQVPLPRILVGYHMPPYRSEDQYPLGLLATILGGGRSSRLDRLLVAGEHPLAVDAGAANYNLEDGGSFAVYATVLHGKDPDEVEKNLIAAVADVRDMGVTNQELAKAKTAERVSFVANRETAEKLATQLGDEALFGGDPTRVNTAMTKIEAVEAIEVQAVAKIYLREDGATILRIKPDPLGKEQRAAATQAAAAAGDNPPDPKPIQPRVVQFPQGYPQEPPLAPAKLQANFAKGAESTINGVKVIVMPDNRLPSIAWSVTLRSGAHLDPGSKEGLAEITAGLVGRGAAGLSYAQLNEDLESRGISINVNEAGDHTRLTGSCLTEQIDHAIGRSRDILRAPTLAADEFAKLKEQILSGLQLARSRPETAAAQALAEALFGSSPLGRFATPKSVASITLDDVKDAYQKFYRPNDAILLIAGDITVERGQELAAKLLDGWQPANFPIADYTLAPIPAKRRIILIDRPEGKQAMIRMAIRAYDTHNDEKFAGSLAGSILSSGIESRLGRYVRAEKGLAYSVYGIFQPNRHAGQFSAGTETDVSTAADAVEAMFKVFADMARDGVTEAELNDARLRIVGSMVMGMQTIGQQADYRVQGILNGYPIDYYDRYPERIGAVAPPQVGQVVQKYVKDDQIVVVVVAPADAVKKQLERLGAVEVIPMP